MRKLSKSEFMKKVINDHYNKKYIEKQAYYHEAENAQNIRRKTRWGR